VLAIIANINMVHSFLSRARIGEPLVADGIVDEIILYC